MLRTSSEILAPIREKVEAGERLSMEDGLVLESPEAPLPEIGELANLVRER
ncbi:MAG: aminofutalosine synthase MqnE, partial [Planctomycetota bacterium]